MVSTHKTTLLVLGRQPNLGLAEAESLFTAKLVKKIGGQCAYIDKTTDEIPFDRLGAATKAAKILAIIPSTNWAIIEKSLQSLVRSPEFALPSAGKFHLGISVIGFSLSPQKINALGLTLKKILKSRHDGSVRLVPNNTTELSTAQVYHSHLTDLNGAELLVVANGAETVVARTTSVQDIDSYTLRDRERPKRDARVGMLPPKLAQIIINLAASQHAAKTTKPPVILDPFCGTGVILQEALLMGYSAYGTDVDARMIRYTEENLDWLSGVKQMQDSQKVRIEEGDATYFTWENPVNSVASETYLGRPFTALPDHQFLEQNVSDVNLILKKFLNNIKVQLVSGTRLCLAVPAWQIKPGLFRHLPLIDSLENLGYNRVSFERVSGPNLIYYRNDQIVARELLVLTVK